MEYFHHCVCVPPGAYHPQKRGWTDRGQDTLQKGSTVNSNITHSSVGYMKNKQSGVSQDSWKGEQNNNTAQRLNRKHIKNSEDNKAHRKCRQHLEGDGYSLKRGKWQAGTLVNALKMVKIRSMHTGQYAGSAPSDHSQRQALVEPLSLLSGVARNVNEFLYKTTQEFRNWHPTPQ